MDALCVLPSQDNIGVVQYYTAAKSLCRCYPDSLAPFCIPRDFNTRASSIVHTQKHLYSIRQWNKIDWPPPLTVSKRWHMLHLFHFTHQTFNICKKQTSAYTSYYIRWTTKLKTAKNLLHCLQHWQEIDCS